jgi:hypothetical protein
MNVEDMGEYGILIYVAPVLATIPPVVLDVTG